MIYPFNRHNDNDNDNDKDTVNKDLGEINGSSSNPELNRVKHKRDGKALKKNVPIATARRSSNPELNRVKHKRDGEALQENVPISTARLVNIAIFALGALLATVLPNVLPSRKSSFIPSQHEVTALVNELKQNEPRIQQGPKEIESRNKSFEEEEVDLVNVVSKVDPDQFQRLRNPFVKEMSSPTGLLSFLRDVEIGIESSIGFEKDIGSEFTFDGDIFWEDGLFPTPVKLIGKVGIYARFPLLRLKNGSDRGC